MITKEQRLRSHGNSFRFSREMMKKRSSLIKNYYFVPIAFCSIFRHRFSNVPSNLRNRRNDEIRANQRKTLETTK